MQHSQVGWVLYMYTYVFINMYVFTMSLRAVLADGIVHVRNNEKCQATN